MTDKAPPSAVCELEAARKNGTEIIFHLAHRGGCAANKGYIATKNGGCYNDPWNALERQGFVRTILNCAGARTWAVLTDKGYAQIKILFPTYVQANKFPSRKITPFHGYVEMLHPKLGRPMWVYPQAGKVPGKYPITCLSCLS